MERRIESQRTLAGRKVGVVVSRWNELVTKELLDGALEELRAHGSPEIVVVQTPGAWEIPIAVQALTDQCDGVVALGCILQGATNHASMLAGDVSSALMSLQVATGKPIAWGILTPENQEQALERAGMKLGNKGREAALSVIEMIGVLGALAGE